MLALDIGDAFGSVSHVQLRNNLSKLGLHPILTGLILDSYTNAQVKVVTLNGATNPIHIKCGVKQGCPLSLQFFLIFLLTLSLKSYPQMNLRNMVIGGQTRMELLLKLTPRHSFIC
jgi:hypothetical protein